MIIIFHMSAEGSQEESRTPMEGFKILIFAVAKMISLRKTAHMKTRKGEMIATLCGVLSSLYLKPARLCISTFGVFFIFEVFFNFQFVFICEHVFRFGVVFIYCVLSNLEVDLIFCVVTFLWSFIVQICCTPKDRQSGRRKKSEFIVRQPLLQTGNVLYFILSTSIVMI